MPTSPAALALWGKLLIHNKILTEQQWDSAQAALQHAGADATVESVLLGQGMLRKAHVDQISARVTQLLGKVQGQAAAAPKPAEPVAPAAPAKPVKPAAEVDELMPDEAPGARGRNSSDTEWVETTENTKAALDFKSKDIVTIDMTEPDPADTGTDKKKIWTPSPGQWNKPMTGPMAEGAGRSKDIPQIPLDGEE